MDQEGGSLASVIAAFAFSDEFDRRYGGLTDSALIDALYQQALGRRNVCCIDRFFCDLDNRRALSVVPAILAPSRNSVRSLRIPQRALVRPDYDAMSP